MHRSLMVLIGRISSNSRSLVQTHFIGLIESLADRNCLKPNFEKQADFLKTVTFNSFVLHTKNYNATCIIIVKPDYI